MKNNKEKNNYQTYGYTVIAPNKKKGEIKCSTIKGNDLRTGGKK
jgi:hypothetical protein